MTERGNSEGAADGALNLFRRVVGWESGFLRQAQLRRPLLGGMRRGSARLYYLLVLWLLGIAILSLITWICFSFGIGSGPTTLVYLIAVVFLSLFDSFVSSVVFSLYVIGCLNLFFIPPLFSFEIGHVQDVLSLAAFLITSLAITTLVRRVRYFGEIHHEEARLLDLIQDPIFVMSIDNRVLYWNRGAVELYGWSSEEAIGQLSHMLLKTVFPVSFEAARDELLETGQWAAEVRRTTRSGAQILVSTRWSLQRDTHGNPVGFLETDTDITQRRRTEEALQRARDSYLAESQALSKTGSLGWNPVSGKIIWSEQTYKIFEYPPSVEPTLDKVMARVHPDDVEMVRKAVEHGIRARRDFSIEHRLLMPDRRVKHLHVVFHANFDEDGTFELMGAVMDVTEGKAAVEALETSERRYRHLFQYVPCAVWHLDTRGMFGIFKELKEADAVDRAYLDTHPEVVPRAMQILLVDEVNEVAVRMMGARRREDLLGPVGPYWRSRPDTFRRALESWFRNEEHFEERTQINTLDGRAVDVLLSIGRTGTGVTIVSAVELTDLVRAEEKLKQAEAEFARAARIATLGELTASIAHEVNQPLAAIATSGGASLRWLNRPEPDVGEVRTLVQGIVADAHRAADVIARIRAMAVRREPERVAIGLDEVIAESLLFLNRDLQVNQVEVFHTPNHTAPNVVADRTQLQQVIVNLATNAVQAMSQEGKPRKLSIEVTAPDEMTILCTVEDSGTGIHPDHIDRLFASFFTTKEGGMGIGLAICRSIVQEHGGRITADNNSRHGGARFRLSLPAAPPDAATGDGGNAAPKPVRRRAYAGQYGTDRTSR